MTLKEKIKNKQKMIGIHINLNDIATAKIASLSGYDYVWVDMEHSYLSLENLLSFIITIKATDTAVIVRAPMDDFTYTKKILEMGPDGIIFPMVRNAEHANSLISYTLYPPYGTRGLGPWNAIDYGISSMNDFIANTCDNVCRFIQIELKEAVDNLEEIMKNDYIDGYIFGPCDLSGSIGELGRVYDEHTTELIKYTTDKLHENGKYVGLSTGDMTEKGLKHWRDLDIDMVSAGADFDFLRIMAQRNRKTMSRIFQPEKVYTEKKYFDTNDKSGYTKDINCSLNPPCVLSGNVYELDCYNDKGRTWQAAPSLTVGGNNVLYLSFHGDNYSHDEGCNNYLVILRSTDGGENWNPITVLDHFDSVRLHEHVLWTDTDGNVWLFWCQSYDWWDGRGGVWSMKMISDDNGLVSWTSPKRLCDGVMATPPITLTNGDIMLPVSIWKFLKPEDSEMIRHSFPYWGNSGVYVSSDKLETVRYVGGADEPDTTFDENAIVERADGSLYMIMRCADKISCSVSGDKGKTWSVPEKVMDHTGSKSFLSKLPSGNYLLVTNDDSKERKNMTAFLSTDECKTWSYKLLLDERAGTSYPMGIALEDGRIYIAYDYNRYVDEEICLASFTEDDIVKGEFTNPDSFTKRLVVKGYNGFENADKLFEDGKNN